jgi:phospholipid/cholesterol/gamma-HCH transport system substrate-binding protein
MRVNARRIIRVAVIVLLAVGTSVLLYLLINNFQFTRGVMVRVHFTAIGDLNTGAWVRKAGLKVGSVTNIQPASDEKTVIVTLTFKPGEVVRQDDKFALISKGILGDMYIEQIPGPKTSPNVEQGHLFEGEPFFSLNDLLGGSTMQVVTDIGSSIKVLGDILKKNEASIDAIIQDIRISAANIRTVSQNVVAVTTDLPALSARLVSSLNDLNETVQNLSRSADRLIAKIEGNLTTGSEDLAASLASIKTSSADIQLIVEKLSAKDSVVTALSSPESAAGVAETLKNLKDVSSVLLKTSQDAQKLVEGITKILSSP